jgi:hypothetical protein
MTAPLIFNTSLAGVADTTAPTLFAGATSVVSTTAWTGVITTDEGNGVLYTLGNQSASASAAAVKAGGTMLAVASAGQKSLSFTGLTPDTSGYYIHIMHEDAAGNQSAVTTIGPFATPDAGEGTGTVSLTIPRRGDILSGGEGVGPFPMFFRTLVDDYITEPASTRDYDPTQVGFAYVVDMGLGGPVRYDYLTHVPDVHNNKNVAYAKEFSACYAPGTYTVTVNVYRHDGTFVGSGSQTFTVRDPLTEITNVFLVNNSGTTDGSYPGAPAYTTLGAAIAAANTSGQTALILMRRGQTHPQNTQIAIPSSCPHFIVSDYGTGTKPLVTTTFGGEFIRPTDQWNKNAVFQNIRFQGGYNTITESGTAPTLYRTGISNPGTTTKGLLFDGCEFDGFNQAANLISTVTETNHFYMLHNCKSDIGRGFYVFQGPNSGTYVSFRGTSMLADPRHALGGGNGGNLYGCMRIVCAKRLFLESSQFFSRAAPNATSNFNLQPTLRLLTAPEDSQQRMFGYMTGCYVDGGNQVVTLSMSNGIQAGDVLHGVNFLGLKNYLVGASANKKMITMRTAGQHWVNNIMVLCDAKSDGTYNPGGWEAFFTFDADKATPPGGEDTTSPVRAWHNTCINLRTVANMNGRDSPLAEFMSIKWSSQWAEAGNIIYQPNLPGEPNTAGVTFTQDSILSDNGQAWVPLWTNVAHRATASLPAVTFDTSYGAASGQAWDGRITAAPTTSRLWYDDFYNVTRGGSTRVGAVGQLST